HADLAADRECVQRDRARVRDAEAQVVHRRIAWRQQRGLAAGARDETQRVRVGPEIAAEQLAQDAARGGPAARALLAGDPRRVRSSALSSCVRSRAAAPSRSARHTWMLSPIGLSSSARLAVGAAMGRASTGTM